MFVLQKKEKKRKKKKKKEMSINTSLTKGKRKIF